jgi:EpsI family protein
VAGDWKGEEVKQQLNLGKGLYAYLGDYQMMRYTNSTGSRVFITLLDAGNFHHPKLCFSGSGYEPKELPDTMIETNNAKFAVPTIFFKKPHEHTLVMYWMSVNKQRVNWTEQKAKEFFYSLIGKKKTGLITRVDILTPESKIKTAVETAQSLLKALEENMGPEQAEYIFGKSQR